MHKLKKIQNLCRYLRIKININDDIKIYQNKNVFNYRQLHHLKKI